ncbi:MAG: glycosyltransferase family 4 protein [Pseudorhodobacter sp.]|nr:glycosyltransferase family 4 protein [Pseudorhodobacter sp.]
MKLLAISEHYFPRVGGTVNYLHETLCALADLGVETELLVPGPMPEDWLPGGMRQPPYRVQWVDACYPAKGDPTREQRYDFCRKADTLAFEKATGPGRPDVLHVMFGLFVMELLDTARLQRAGLPCLATVHNVPPMECRLVPDTAPLAARLKEMLRLKAVAFKNHARLKKHAFDLYVVPSQQVSRLLAAIIDGRLDVIGHGLTSDLQARMKPPGTRRPQGPVRLLTVGGYAPHKRQNLIPEVAARLRDSGLTFEWDIVGPTGRLAGYFDGVVAEVARHGLAGAVHARAAVPVAELATLYDAAHLYVQPSIEEGFCITALDAAAVGLPVIASPAGALAQIAEASGGALVESDPKWLAKAIGDFVSADRWRDPAEVARAVRVRFSWEMAAQTLRARYQALVDEAATVA